MARLSAENFRKDNKRKSSNPFTRLMRNSKSRSGSREEQSTTQTTTQPDSPSQSQSPSPNPAQIHGKLRKGFTKVGVFPSERVSGGSEMGSTDVAGNVIAEREENLKGVSAPYSLDTSLDAAGAIVNTNAPAPGNTEGFARLPTGEMTSFDEDAEITVIYRGGDAKVKNEESASPCATKGRAELNNNVFLPGHKIRMESMDSSQTKAAASSDINNRRSGDHPAPNDLLPVPKTDAASNEKEENNVLLPDGSATRGVKFRSMSLGMRNGMSAPVESSDEAHRIFAIAFTTIERSFQTHPRSLTFGPFTFTAPNAIRKAHRGLLCFWLTILVLAALSGSRSLLGFYWRAGVLAVMYIVWKQKNGGGCNDNWATVETIWVPLREVAFDVPSAVWKDLVFALGYGIGVFMAGTSAGSDSIVLS